MASMTGCRQQANYKYSEKETEQFLNEITKNAKVGITDITEIKKQPTDKFGILTRCALSKKQLEEYNNNNHSIINVDIRQYSVSKFGY